MLSTVVEMVVLVVLDLRPALQAVARRSENLPASLTALDNRVDRTEPKSRRQS